MYRRKLAVVLVLNLLGNVLGRPADFVMKRGLADNDILDSGEMDSALVEQDSSSGGVVKSAANVDSESVHDTSTQPPPSPQVIKDIFGTANQTPSPLESEEPPLNPAATLPPIPDNPSSPVTDDETSDDDDDDDDDDDFETMNTAPSTGGGGGSSIISLLNLATAFFPSLSGNVFLPRVLKELARVYLKGGFTFSPDELLRIRRDTKDNKIEIKLGNTKDNEIDIDDIVLKPPPLQRQEEGEDSGSSESSNNTEESSENENNAAEESQENPDDPKDGNGSDKESSADTDEESDEPPEGSDGQGGGILGLLAGLSGGEDGQSDLGSLLAAVSGIVANLSGDGVDVNALIASGIGLFVGLLSEGNENPGAVIASYLLTSLDTLSGGGAKNNGAFFGTFLSKLVKGTSAGGDPDASSVENGNNMPMADSSGFFLGFLMGLLGDMSKGSSQPWR